MKTKDDIRLIKLHAAKIASPKNVEEPYNEGGECELSQLNDDSYAQPLHFVEECKHKRIDEESHEKTYKKRMT